MAAHIIQWNLRQAFAIKIQWAKWRFSSISIRENIPQTIINTAIVTISANKKSHVHAHGLPSDRDRSLLLLHWPGMNYQLTSATSRQLLHLRNTSRHY